MTNHKILFTRLLKMNFPVHLTRFFLTWYKDQHMCVRWKNAFSDSYPISNGVWQGGVLSPILFTIYIDDLLDDLHNRGVGCFWDSIFADAMVCADDVVLWAPSSAALRIMLRCCKDFTFEHGLQFNPSKTQLIRFSWSSSSSCTACYNFCGQQLSFYHSSCMVTCFTVI